MAGVARHLARALVADDLGHEEVLGESLRRGTSESLNAHLNQLETLRQEFLTACQLVVAACIGLGREDRAGPPDL